MLGSLNPSYHFQEFDCFTSTQLELRHLKLLNHFQYFFLILIGHFNYLLIKSVGLSHWHHIPVVHLLHFGEWQTWQCKNVKSYYPKSMSLIGKQAQNFGLNDTTKQIVIQHSQSPRYY